MFWATTEEEVRTIKVVSRVRIGEKEMVIRLLIENPNLRHLKFKRRSHGQTANMLIKLEDGPRNPVS